MRLNTYSWGYGDGSPIVCVHGVAGHAEIFRKLAEDTLADRPVLAMDLRGHGRSGWLPPWNLETHVADLAETAAVYAIDRATWIGFSFGGRLVAELALAEPRLASRLVLLEPVLQLPPQDGLEAAERLGQEETYASADEAVEALAAAVGLSTPRELLVVEAGQHLTEAADGRLRFRYSPSAAVTAWGEMTRPPVPPAGVPTLIVVGTQSRVPIEADLERYRAVLGDQLKVERLPSQHWLLWNAFQATAVPCAPSRNGRGKPCTKEEPRHPRVSRRPARVTSGLGDASRASHGCLGVADQVAWSRAATITRRRM